HGAAKLGQTTGAEQWSRDGDGRGIAVELETAGQKIDGVRSDKSVEQVCVGRTQDLDGATVGVDRAGARVGAGALLETVGRDDAAVAIDRSVGGGRAVQGVGDDNVRAAVSESGVVLHSEHAAAVEPSDRDRPAGG